MNAFISWMERYFVPVASKVGGQRHLVVIRDSFATAMPLILAGAFAVLLNNIWDALDALFGTSMKASLTANIGWLFELNGIIWWGSFAILALFLVISISYRLAVSYGQDGLSATVISVAVYFMQIPQIREINGADAWGFVGVADLGVATIFSAIIISMVATELYVFFVKKNIVIRMPDSVPPAVSRAFTAFIPALIIFYLLGGLALFMLKNPFTVAGIEINNIIVMFNALLQAPFMQLGQSLYTVLLISFFIPVFWFVGLHGANLVGPLINSVYLPAVIENAEAVNAGLAMPNIWTSVSWDIYVNLGGVGATLALLIAIFIASKQESYRSVAKTSLAPGIFMINEPVMFGLPVVLNPVLIVPFVTVPLVLTIIAYTATKVGIVPPTSVIVPWTTPPVLGAFLATGGSIAAALLALMNFVIAIVIYLPFVHLSNRMKV